MDAAAILRAVDRVCVVGVGISYAGAVVWCLVVGNPRVWSLVAVPAVGFVLLSWVRARIDAPRPYEVGRSTPLLKADTVGRSFPSRHVGSGALIGSALLFTQPVLGVWALAATAALAVVRVVGGVHFVRDVVAGYAGGFAFGLAGMLLCGLLL